MAVGLGAVAQAFRQAFGKRPLIDAGSDLESCIDTVSAAWPGLSAQLGFAGLAPLVESTTRGKPRVVVPSSLIRLAI